MKLFIDANILIDVLAAREPFCSTSSIVWKICETCQAEGIISALSCADLIYIMRKDLDPNDTENVLKKLDMIFCIEDLKGNDIKKAAALKWQDSEDALQSVIAERVGADLIVTRNTGDFTASRVKAVTPEKLISRIMRNQDSHDE